MASSFEHIQKTGNVGVHISLRIFQAVPHTCLCGQVNDTLGLTGLIDPSKRGRIRDIDFVKTKSGFLLQSGKTRELEIDVVVVVEVVYADHFVTSIKQHMGCG